MDISYFKSDYASIQKLRYFKGKIKNDIIIQRGPQLLTIKSFYREKDFKVNTKKIKLGNRPVSLCKLKKSIAQQAEKSFNDNIIDKDRLKSSSLKAVCNFIQIKDISPKASIKENPFQNEYLRSFLSKKYTKCNL